MTSSVMTSSVMNFDTAIKEGEIRMQALEQKHIYVIIIGLTVSSYKLTILRHSVLHPLIWPQSEKRTVLFPGHLAITASGTQKYKLSLQRHSSVPMLSFDTEEEELNIASRADTMMTAPSSCSMTNGRVCSSHIQWANRQRHYALHKLPLLLRTAPPSETCLKAREGNSFRKAQQQPPGNHGSDVSH